MQAQGMSVFRIKRAQQRPGETVKQGDHGGLQDDGAPYSIFRTASDPASRPDGRICTTCLDL
jgi:hypothetical protein